MRLHRLFPLKVLMDDDEALKRTYPVALWSFEGFGLSEAGVSSALFIAAAPVQFVRIPCLERDSTFEQGNGNTKHTTARFGR